MHGNPIGHDSMVTFMTLEKKGLIIICGESWTRLVFNKMFALTMYIVDISVFTSKILHSIDEVPVNFIMPFVKP